MTHTVDTLIAHVRRRLQDVRRSLGAAIEEADDPDTRFGDVLDSMALVEFVACLAEDCGVNPDMIERCVGHRFGTVAEVAAALHAAGIVPQRPTAPFAVPRTDPTTAPPVPCWLAATAVRLPQTRQPAAALDVLLHRPPGWLERHAGIAGRHLWAEEDPLHAAVEAARACLQRVGLATDDVGALLVTSEAPPLLAGQAAALHHALDLRPEAVALEVGGACTGFLAALWLARSLLAQVGALLVVAVEAPSRYLEVAPGPAGDVAALFGDAAAACLLCDQATGPEAVPIRSVLVGSDGAAGRLLRVERVPSGRIEIAMEGTELAGRAVRAMAEALQTLLSLHGLTPGRLDAVVAHGGNGRMPSLLGRRLGLGSERIWSETARTGNLGSASLPVAWAAHQPPRGPVAWLGVGAGLTWAAALTGADAG
jgi:3-oxoacyl-[acyl-carrier-protein] synthase-3